MTSGITYGSKALLKFTDTESENSSGLEIGGKIEAGINLLVASVSASIGLEIGEKEKKVMKSLECEFLGDYSGRLLRKYSTCQTFHFKNFYYRILKVPII